MKIFDLCSHLVRILYTLLMRGRFGKWGKGSRLWFPATLHNPHLIQVGESAVIREHTWLTAKDKRVDGRATLIIGDGTYIGRFAQINAWQDVVIEPNVLIADRVYISDADHLYSDPNMPIKLQGDHFVGAVRLCSGCWIGVGAVIMPGISVGKNAIVGANAVVTRDVPSYSVVVGNSARIITKVDYQSNIKFSVNKDKDNEANIL